MKNDKEHVRPKRYVEAIEQISKANPGDVQQIAASQIELLNSYYDAVLDQAETSFKWALIAAGVGLGLFVVSEQDWAV